MTFLDRVDSAKLVEQEIKNGAGKCHNPWFAKSRMFGETIAEVSEL